MIKEEIVKPKDLRALASVVSWDTAMIPRQYINYWLVNYTDKSEIFTSSNILNQADLYLFCYLNRDKIVSDLYNEIKQDQVDKKSKPFKGVTFTLETIEELEVLLVRLNIPDYVVKNHDYLNTEKSYSGITGPLYWKLKTAYDNLT